MTEENLIFERNFSKQEIFWNDILKLEDVEIDDKNHPILNDNWELDPEFGSFHYRSGWDEQVKNYILPRVQSLRAMNYQVAIAQPKEENFKKDGVYFLLRKDLQK